MQKATKRNTKKPQTTGQLTEALLTAAGLCYPTDPSQAGIVLSRLKDGSYYASLCRYTLAYGQGKAVICKARGTSADEAITALAREWRSAPRDAASALAALDRLL